jgi:hypothetical protein
MTHGIAVRDAGSQQISGAYGMQVIVSGEQQLKPGVRLHFVGTQHDPIALGMRLNIQINGKQLRGTVRRVDINSADIEVAGQIYAICRGHALPTLYGQCWIVV